MNAFKFLFQSLILALYPNKCVACDTLIPEGESFCDCCFEMLPKTGVDKRCLACGNPKKQCVCKHRVFHFTATTAPFYNEGPAKHAFYIFKFKHKPFSLNFFANQMALTVKNDFYGKDFNAVVYVPMPLSHRLKRGYNQSRELALKVAEKLEIPLVENALGCNKKRKIQHKTPLKERFENVKGMYYPNISLNGRRVLLVDDIKTTGATLNECARALLKAGAADVHCVTALTVRHKKENLRK